MRVFALIACLIGSAATAQDDAQDAAAQLMAAEAQLRAAEGSRDRIAALTQTVQAYEAGLTAMRAEQREVALQEAILAEELTLRRDEFAQLLGVLSAISATPQAVLRSHPDGPLNAARAGMLVADVTPGLRAEVVELNALLDETKQLAEAQATAAQTLTEGLQGAQVARTALGQAVSERTDLPARFEDDPVQTALLVASAQTLEAFAAQISDERPDTRTDFVADGNLPLPVEGVILPQDDSARPGVRIAAAPRALVTAPVPATVLFQGQLLDYGNVVILEPAADVLFVLAGFEDVFSQTGQVLPAGAPIGLLGAGTGFNDSILTENIVAAGRPDAQVLYLEVRDGQTPVDPDVWFAVNEAR